MTGGDYDTNSPEVYAAVTLDRLGERYGLLPSEVLMRATTLDISVMDISISYEQARRDQAEGRPAQINQDQFADRLKKFKERTHDNKHRGPNQ